MSTKRKVAVAAAKDKNDALSDISNVAKKQKKTAPTRKNRAWDQSLEALVVYKNQTGNCDVPLRYAEDGTLGQWVTRQRQRKSKL